MLSIRNKLICLMIAVIIIITCIPNTVFAGSLVRKLNFTNLGNKFKSLSTYAGVFVKNDKGQRIYYGVTRTGNVCNLFSFNTDTEKVKNIISIKGVNGAWAVIREGDYIYIGTYLKASLYRYDIKRGTLQRLADIPSASYIWDMKLYNNKIYIGTSENGSIYEYDMKTGKVRLLARVTKGQYVRSLDIYKNKIYAGTGANTAELIEYDIATGKYKNILPSKYNKNNFVYDLKVIDSKLFMIIRPSFEIAVYDLDKNVFLPYSRILHKENYTKKATFSKDTIHFADINGTVLEYNKENGDINLFNNMSTFKCEVVDDSYLSGITPEGTYVEFNFNGKIRKKVDLIDNGLEGINTLPMSITANNGRVYLGEKRLGIYSDFDDTMIYKVVEGEPKALCFLGDTLFSANYTFAKIWKYGKTVLDNPLDYDYDDLDKYLAFSIGNNQNRPKKIIADNEARTVLIGTEPNYGKYGGALTVYSDKTNENYTISNIVPRHTVWDVQFDGNNKNVVYIGTSVYGGSGTIPLNENAHIVKWDLQKQCKIWDVVPEKNNSTILSMIHKNNRVYCVTANGNILALDDKTGVLLKINNKYKFKYILSSIDGKIYGITSNSFCIISENTLDSFALKNDFACLSYLITEDPVTGKIYFFDGYNMWRYE